MKFLDNIFNKQNSKNQQPSFVPIKERKPGPNDQFFNRIFPDNFWPSMDRSRFITHEHSMLADEPVFEWLIKTVRPETIVELGSWQGHSANHMADICKAEGLDSRIVCVDTFLGGPEHWVLGDTIDTMRRRNGMPTILEAFLGNTVARGNEGRIFPFTVDTATGWQVMRDLGFKADLIYVDAGHAYHQVVDEVHGYLPRLNEGGVMFGDDYYFEPVARAAQDMAKHYGFSLGVLQRRKWVFMTDRLMQSPAPEELGFEIRTEPYPE